MFLKEYAVLKQINSYSYCHKVASKPQDLPPSSANWLKMGPGTRDLTELEPSKRDTSAQEGKYL